MNSRDLSLRRSCVAITMALSTTLASGCGGDSSSGGGTEDAGEDATAPVTDATLPTDDANGSDGAMGSADAADATLGNDAASEDATVGAEDAGLHATADAAVDGSSRDAEADAGGLDAGADATVDSGNEDSGSDGGRDAETDAASADAGGVADGGVMTVVCNVEVPDTMIGFDEPQMAATDSNGALHVFGFAEVNTFGLDCTETSTVMVSAGTGNSLAPLSCWGFSPAGDPLCTFDSPCCAGGAPDAPSACIGSSCTLGFGNWILTGTRKLLIATTDDEAGSPPPTDIYGVAESSSALYVNSAAGFSPFGLPGDASLSPLFTNASGDLFAAGSALKKLSTTTGAVLWSGPYADWFAFDSNDDVIAFTGSELVKLSGANGTTEWAQAAPSGASTAQRVWLDTSNNIYALQSNGVTRYTSQGTSPVFASFGAIVPISASSMLFAGGTPSGDLMVANYQSGSAYVTRLHFPP